MKDKAIFSVRLLKSFNLKRSSYESLSEEELTEEANRKHGGPMHGSVLFTAMRFALSQAISLVIDHRCLTGPSTWRCLLKLSH